MEAKLCAEVQHGVRESPSSQMAHRAFEALRRVGTVSWNGTMTEVTEAKKEPLVQMSHGLFCIREADKMISPETLSRL